MHQVKVTTYVGNPEQSFRVARCLFGDRLFHSNYFQRERPT